MEPNARLRILAHYESGIAKFISNNGKCPCLLVKLASETSFSSPAMRAEISLAYRSMVELYEQVIQEGQDQGYISDHWDAAFTASIITSLWLGALEKALIHQKVDIMRDALVCISSTIIAPAVALNKSA
jgi:hypothetical protein